MKPAHIDRAFQLREEARLAAEQGNLERAEVLYVESKELFLQYGSTHLIDAAMNLNAIASMKEKQNDPGGALNAAQNSLKLLQDHNEESTNEDADRARFDAWNVIGSIHMRLANYEEAEHAFQNALKNAPDVFDNANERTQQVRQQLIFLDRTKL